MSMSTIFYQLSDNILATIIPIILHQILKVFKRSRVAVGVSLITISKFQPRIYILQKKSFLSSIQNFS